MKINKQQLQRIIKEEVDKAVHESYEPVPAAPFSRIAGYSDDEKRILVNIMKEALLSDKRIGKKPITTAFIKTVEQYLFPSSQ